MKYPKILNIKYFNSKEEQICLCCKGLVKIRNPKGYCDHLKYPEYCNGKCKPPMKKEEIDESCDACVTGHSKSYKKGNQCTFCDEFPKSVKKHKGECKCICHTSGSPHYSTEKCCPFGIKYGYEPPKVENKECEHGYSFLHCGHSPVRISELEVPPDEFFNDAPATMRLMGGIAKKLNEVIRVVNALREGI